MRGQTDVVRRGDVAIGVQPKGIESHVVAECVAVCVAEVPCLVSRLEGEQEMSARGEPAGKFSKYARRAKATIAGDRSMPNVVIPGEWRWAVTGPARSPSRRLFGFAWLGQVH